MDVLTFETCWAVNSEIMKQVTSSLSIFIQQPGTPADTKTATNHTPSQQLIDISSDSVTHKGIPIAIVRVRHKIL